MSNTNAASQDRLGLHGDVPIPTPLVVIRKKNAPKLGLPRIDEDKHNDANNYDAATERTASLTRSVSFTPAELYRTMLPQYQAQPQEACNPHFQGQCKPQAQPHPTKTMQAKNAEEISILPLPRSSSLNTLTSESSTPSLHPSNSLSTRSTAQQKLLKTTSSTPLLGSFDEQLPALPHHLQPGNKYSPRPFPDASPRIHLAATTAKHRFGVAGVVEKQAEILAAHSIIHEATKNRGRSHHSPTGSICSFTGENKTLEAEILALLDDMSGAGGTFPPPPYPPPNHPPPPPPAEGSRRQSSGGLPGSAIAT